MCILNLFNFHQTMTNEDIQEAMGFDEETTKKNVHSLTTPKAKILVFKEGVWQLNSGFQSKLRRVNFPVPMLEESVKKERIK